MGDGKRQFGKTTRADLAELVQGRRHAERRAWADAFRALSQADQKTPLAVEDLELLATSAYLIGEDSVFLHALDRAHGAYLSTGEPRRAARCAFWLGLVLLFMGETGRGTGWLALASRLLEDEAADCAERAYLLLPTTEQHLRGGEHDAAYAKATAALEMGQRFADADLVSCARHLQGRALIGQGLVEDGLALLDEAMIAVTAGKLSPVMTGLVYCSVIDTCQQVYALARAWEWTSALAQWCAEQPQMVAFTGTCLVHRAEIMRLHGAWQDAIEEARCACERQYREMAQPSAAMAFYQQAEVHRLRGEFAAADAAYRDASRRGCDPQPGLALLRMAQGRAKAASAAIRRAVSATTDELQRAKLLPAYVEIMLGASDIEGARGASRQLAGLAARFDTDVLRAMAAHARGAVELSYGFRLIHSPGHQWKWVLPLMRAGCSVRARQR